MTDRTQRTVHDSLGELQVPVEAYYGAQTARAIDNFPISGLKLPRSFIRAQAVIKWAAAKAHADLDALSKDKANAICEAATEVAEGQLDEWFLVDVYQAGAGTSQNMNVNEVIANRACELLGGDKGDTALVHPNDDVNRSQSTNDTIHVAMNIAGMEMLAYELDPALATLQIDLEEKAQAFDHIVKSGRTHLQDAVPLRLGDEFRAYSENIARHRIWLEQAASNLLAIGIGGNAVGTGINTPQGFDELAAQYISEYTQLAFHLPSNTFLFNQNPDEIVMVSGVLRSLAQVLGRIANDFRLMASGPRTGLAEIQLPAVQPGSSIMPGKVNPVMAEMLNMIAYQVAGCDTAVANAGAAGQLELNVMMPVMAANFLHAIHILSTGVEAFADKCVRGIEADEERCRWYANQSLSLATALNVELGYETASKIVKEALKHDISLAEAGRNIGIDETIMNQALDIDKISRPSTSQGQSQNGDSTNTAKYAKRDTGFETGD